MVFDIYLLEAIINGLLVPVNVVLDLTPGVDPIDYWDLTGDGFCFAAPAGMDVATGGRCPA